MKQDEILQLVREVGGFCDVMAKGRSDGILFTPGELERYTQMVIERERKFWHEQIAVEVHEALLEEREAFSKKSPGISATQAGTQATQMKVAIAVREACHEAWVSSAENWRSDIDLKQIVCDVEKSETQAREAQKSEVTEEPRVGKTYFSWMGAFWSCTPEIWATINEKVEQDQPFDLEALGVRQLKSRPNGTIHLLRDVEPRGEER